LVFQSERIVAVALALGGIARGDHSEPSRRKTKEPSREGAQAAEHHPIRELIACTVDNLNGDLSVPTLARRAGMSERNFGRIFQTKIRLPPTRHVAQQRLETARRMLEETGKKVNAIALSAGFRDGEALRRALPSRLRISPALYPKRFEADQNRRIPR